MWKFDNVGRLPFDLKRAISQSDSTMFFSKGIVCEDLSIMAGVVCEQISRVSLTSDVVCDDLSKRSSFTQDIVCIDLFERLLDGIMTESSGSTYCADGSGVDAVELGKSSIERFIMGVNDVRTTTDCKRINRKKMLSIVL